MDEKTMREYAVEASERFTNALNEAVAKSEYEWIKKLEPAEVKVNGIYQKPFTNKWELHFVDKSENSVSSWVIYYEPKTNISAEEHIKEILRLLDEHQSFR